VTTVTAKSAYALLCFDLEFDTANSTPHNPPVNYPEPPGKDLLMAAQLIRKDKSLAGELPATSTLGLSRTERGRERES